MYLNLSVPDDCFKYLSLYETYTAFKIKQTTGNGNAGTCEKNPRPEPDPTPVKSRCVCASALRPRGYWDRLLLSSVFYSFNYTSSIKKYTCKIHFSFCIVQFMFLAYRPNPSEVVRTTLNAKKALKFKCFQTVWLNQQFFSVGICGVYNTDRIIGTSQSLHVKQVVLYNRQSERKLCT